MKKTKKLQSLEMIKLTSPELTGKLRAIFTDKFKRSALARFRSEGQNATDLAVELKIRRNMLYKWAEKIDKQAPDEKFRSLGRPAGYAFKERVKNMHVRKAFHSDATTISQIASQTFALACPPNTPLDELQKYIDENLSVTSFDAVLLAGKCDIRVLEDAGRVIGFTLVDHTPAPVGIAAADDMPELTRCYVRLNYHGKGAAQKLLQATLDDVSTQIRLTVNDQNNRAIRFYARNGFTEVGETRFQCGNDVHRDIVMVR